MRQIGLARWDGQMKLTGGTVRWEQPQQLIESPTVPLRAELSSCVQV